MYLKQESYNIFILYGYNTIQFVVNVDTLRKRSVVDVDVVVGPPLHTQLVLGKRRLFEQQSCRRVFGIALIAK